MKLVFEVIIFREVLRDGYGELYVLEYLLFKTKILVYNYFRIT